MLNVPPNTIFINIFIATSIPEILMKYIKLTISISLLITAIHYSAFSQQDSVSLNSIIEKTTKLSSEQPAEKVYIHFDKPYYAIGDTIWFKSYVTTIENQLSPLSKIVYVEIMTSKDSLVRTLKLPVTNGVAPGNIPLTASSYNQGNYRVRAYTKWMLNFGDSAFFNKVIPVGNGLKKELITHITYARPLTGKDLQTKVRVQYKDSEGKPYGNRKVNWSVKSGYDELSKGKGTTDANGFLALTLTMNKKQEGIPEELITVMSVDDQKELTSSFPLKTAFNSLDVQFFPEGGDLIDGISTKVAFKSIKTDGSGQNIKGDIVDNEGKVVVSFASQHLGMGFFTLFPEAGKTYKANVVLPDGSKATYPLPAVKPEGINLQVNSSDPENLQIKISANAAYFQKFKNRGFYVVGKNGAVIYYAAQSRLNSQVFTAAIPKNKFPPGILQLTLMTTAGDPISERLVFIQPLSGVKMAVSTDKPAYTSKQKVRLALSAKNETTPVEGSFSIAVTDETKVPFDENNETTILSSLLLTSDLKGYVEKPNYYFNKPDQKKLADLDVLMLTQGYRTFSYPDIIASKLPAISFLPEQSIEVTGTLRTNTGMPVNKGNVRLNIPDRNFSTYSITNTEGRFSFSNLVLADTSNVILEPRSYGSSGNMMIMVDGSYAPAITKNKNVPQEILNIDSTLNTYVENSKKQYRNTQLLEEVVITEKQAKGPSHADHAALSGLSVPDHLIPGERFKDCPYLLNCLQTSAMGMTFDKEQFYVTRNYNAGSRVPVQVYLNGMAVDVNALNTVTSAEVESVEIFLKDQLGLVNKLTQTDGILVVNTKKVKKGTPVSKQQLQELLAQRNQVSINGIGYAKERQFYSPKYDNPNGPIVNDLRTTIYWNPQVVTDQTGAAVVEYYNASGKGSYRIVIEGIDKNGNLTRHVQRYTVK